MSFPLYSVYATELGCSSESVTGMRFNVEGFLYNTQVLYFFRYVMWILCCFILTNIHLRYIRSLNGSIFLKKKRFKLVVSHNVVNAAAMSVIIYLF